MPSHGDLKSLLLQFCGPVDIERHWLAAPSDVATIDEEFLAIRGARKHLPGIPVEFAQV